MNSASAVHNGHSDRCRGCNVRPGHFNPEHEVVATAAPRLGRVRRATLTVASWLLCLGVAVALFALGLAIGHEAGRRTGSQTGYSTGYEAGRLDGRRGLVADIREVLDRVDGRSSAPAPERVSLSPFPDF